MFIYCSPSINREAAKDLAARGRIFGIRVTRIWSPSTTTHFLLDHFPSTSSIPIELLCGLIKGSRFLNTNWLEALLQKCELPRGSGNLEEEYIPPDIERPEYVPNLENPNSEEPKEVWEPFEERQSIFHDFKFVVLYEGKEVSTQLLGC